MSALVAFHPPSMSPTPVFWGWRHSIQTLSRVAGYECECSLSFFMFGRGKFAKVGLKKSRISSFKYNPICPCMLEACMHQSRTSETYNLSFPSHTDDLTSFNLKKGCAPRRVRHWYTHVFAICVSNIGCCSSQKCYHSCSGWGSVLIFVSDMQRKF